MNPEQVFTSTGNKLIHHPEILQEIKYNGMFNPVSLQIAPTALCSLNCCFCSNANRAKGEELDFKLLRQFLRDMKELGAKTIEWTGGGEPTMYSRINSAIGYAFDLGYEQGLITNGTGFKAIGSSIRFLKWIRISMNVLDYRDHIQIPEMPDGTTLGFSYVINTRTNWETIKIRLDAYAAALKPKYVRIVPDCHADNETQEINNKVFSGMVHEWGRPYFYQAKHFRTPKHCWWGYLKPFLLHNGWVYPCSSVVLNSDSETSFHKKYQWYRMEQMRDIYLDGPFPPFDNASCDNCVFCSQNELIDGLMNPNGMESFI